MTAGEVFFLLWVPFAIFLVPTALKQGTAGVGRLRREGVRRAWPRRGDEHPQLSRRALIVCAALSLGWVIGYLAVVLQSGAEVVLPSR